MAKDKPFFDHEEVLERYLGDQRPDNPKATLERPLFLELAGDLRELDIVDLGCGDGLFGLEAFTKGAATNEGIELSKAMLEVARKALAHTPAKLHRKAIEDWRGEPEQAELVAARLSLNYVAALPTVFSEVYKALRPGGRFIISVEHPVISSNYRNLEKGKRTSWLVDDYFKTGPRRHTWLGEEVTKYHHTLEDWLNLFTEAGFRLDAIRESRPRRVHFQSLSEYERRLRIPLMLFVVGSKPDSL